MENKSLYIAFSNQKGGVGKSAFTTIVASYLHYSDNRNVVIVDCDYPQFSIHTMRERDKNMVNSNDMLKEMMVQQFDSCNNKKAYTILTSKPEDAIEAADQYRKTAKTPVDVFLFDVSGTVYSEGILNTILNLDYLFCPIITDRLVMQSSLSFFLTINEYLKRNPNVPLKGIFMFWNQLIQSENKKLYDAYCEIIKKLNISRLQTEIPFTIKYKKELSIDNRQVFRSTLFPPAKTLIKGSNLDLLIKEILKITKL